MTDGDDWRVEVKRLVEQHGGDGDDLIREMAAKLTDATPDARRTELFAALPGPLQQALGGAPPAGGPAERLTLAEAVRYEDAWAAATPAERGVVRWMLAHGDEDLDRGLRAVLDSLLGQPDRAAGWRDPAAVKPDVSSIGPADLDLTTEPPPRQWLVGGLIPAGRLTMLTGAGEAGKSRLLLQIAAGVVRNFRDLPILKPDPDLDQPFRDDFQGGLPTIEKTGKVLIVTWEDEPDELVRRLRMAARAGAVDSPDAWSEVERKRLLVVNMRMDQAGPLWAPQPGGHTSTEGGWTPAGLRVLELMRDADEPDPGKREPPVLTIIDPAAAGYACSENDRGLVRRFCAALDAVGEETGSAVILCAHPPKPDKSGSGAAYSGSTDWRNASRALLTLEPTRTGYVVAGTQYVCEKCGAGEGGDPVDAPAVVRDKSSYGPRRKPLFLKSHYLSAKEAERGAELAWFATTAQNAAAAVAGTPGVELPGGGGGAGGAADPYEGLHD